MVLQNSETQIKKIMTTFSCGNNTQHKRLAPIAPSSSSNTSTRNKIDLDDEETNSQQQELLIKVPLNKLPNDQHLSLLSSSSCSSSNNNKDDDNKTTTTTKNIKFSSSSASSSTTSSKIIKTTNIICSTISSVSSPSTGSTSSSSSNESVIISTSSPPSSKINSPRSFYHNNLDGSNSFEEVIIDLDHREMAIDCPDSFMPQFKTRPVYPPMQIIQPPLPETTASTTTTTTKPSTTTTQPTKSSSSIIKPLLTILSGNKPTAQSLRVVENNNQPPMIEMTTTAKPTDFNPLSCSFSSIQFIDDDAKSRTNLNDTTATLTTPLVVVNNKENNLLQLELTTTSPPSPNSKPSVGKRLFEKQQQKLSNIENTNSQVSFKFGTVNSGFEMDVDLDHHEIKPSIIKTTRAPTPPNPNQPNNFTCINIIESESNQVRTNLETFVELNSTTTSTKKQREIINNIDLIEQKISQTLAATGSSTPQTTVSSVAAASETISNLDQSFDNICKSCQSNINYLRKLIKPDLRNAIDVGYLVLELNEKYDFRPSSIAAESSCLVDEIVKVLKSREESREESLKNSDELAMSATELCLLLSRLDIRNLLSSHDQVAMRYQTLINEQQTQNIIEHKRYQEIKKYQQQQQQQQKQRYDEDSLENLILEPRLVDVEEVEEEDDDEEEVEAIENSQEGKYLLDKARHYAVENLKLVNIEKMDAPLGATIRNRDGSIVISRIVVGGAAQRSGLLHENDEILEINNIPVRGKTINDICDMLSNLQGIVSFLIIPNMDYNYDDGLNHQVNNEPNDKEKKMMSSTMNQTVSVCENNKTMPGNIRHIRALFNYSPQEDLYIPCKELGLGFSKGDILHVIAQDDCDWWQAYRDDDKDQTSLAGLIPSQSFQEKRFSQMQVLIGDSFMDRKKREKGFCIKNSHKNRRRRHLQNGMNDAGFLGEDILTYEEVCLYKPLANRKRPIVLIGPHSIGRHELRKRLMQSNPSLFEVAVPHTTRLARRDEVDGKDYHFLPRHIFEADIKQGRFIEYGEYERNLYGTSYEAIRRVIDNSKICVLNLYPQALKTLRNSDLMPYVIYVGPPNLNKLKELKTKLSENYKENDLLDIIDKGREIEELYGHYFDKIIRNTDMDKTYLELYQTILSVQSEENWVPTSWLK